MGEGDMQTHEHQAAAVVLGTGYTHTVEVASVHDPELKGSVTFRLLTVKEHMQAGIKQMQYRGGAAPEMLDFWTNQLARIAAELELAVVEAPAWWYRQETKPGGRIERIPDPANLRDVQVLIDIWEAYVAFRDRFPAGGRPDSSRQGSS